MSNPGCVHGADPLEFCAECERFNHRLHEIAAAPSNRLAQLEAENTALKAQIAKGLDYEHHSSCGHVWTMRHTACPECFVEMRMEIDSYRQSRADMDARHAALRARVTRLETAIQTALDSPCTMGADDIDILSAALAETEGT